MPIDVALGILCRICDGLHAAHRATATDGTPLNLIHRDVKSANVLVSKQGSVKVVDFGIAKAASRSHLTVAGETKGTPSMMAPEQRVGEQVDVRADVYAVAAVGFEVMTGHGVNLDLAALAHLGVENWPHLPPPSIAAPAAAARARSDPARAMSFERESRPADCAAFEAHVRAADEEARPVRERQGHRALGAGRARAAGAARAGDRCDRLAVDPVGLAQKRTATPPALGST